MIIIMSIMIILIIVIIKIIIYNQIVQTLANSKLS